MSKILQDDWVSGTTQGFSFSGIRPEKLSASEYTLATIVCDVTGSVASFESAIRDAVMNAIEACRRSPRAENLLLRLVEFNTNVREKFGFKPLLDINPNDYKAPSCNGGTALYDALYSSIEASNQYAKTLSDQEFAVNSIIFVITDGDDNASRATVKMVKDALLDGTTKELLESNIVVLIGINAGSCSTYLNNLQQACGLTQYVDIQDADDRSLAKLASFISRSISSQSQALGSGGPSQALVF